MMIAIVKTQLTINNSASQVNKQQQQRNETTKRPERKCIHNMRNGKGARACAKTDPVKQSEMSVPAMEMIGGGGVLKAVRDGRGC